MTEPQAPASPEQPRKTGPSTLKMILFLAIFFLLVFIIAMLMLPDHGRSLLRLGSNHPPAQTVAMTAPGNRSA
jgi:hypothetical protein